MAGFGRIFHRVGWGVIWVGLVVGELCVARCVASTGSVTTLTASGGSSAGSAVTLMAAVSAGGAAVTAGQVVFCDAAAAYCTGIHVLGTAQLTSAGMAVVRVVPGIGGHRYRAVFLGTRVYAGSASSVVEVVGAGMYPTATALTVSGGVGSYGLTATVTGAAGVGSATGTVSFVDTSRGGHVLETAAVGAGTVGWGFATGLGQPAGQVPGSVAVGDFNGDGIPDLAVGSMTAGTVSILLGRGDGTFAAGVSVGTRAVPVSLVVGDFNSDGSEDLAVLLSDGGVEVFAGRGDGTFGAGVEVATGVAAVSGMVAGDFNGDGSADLLVNGSSAAMLLGGGDGTFRVAAVGLATGAMVTGDFNGDGTADVAVGGQPIAIFLGNGDGTFASATGLAVGNLVSALAVGDFNGDGRVDLAALTLGTVTMFLGNGDGTFTGVVAATGVTVGQQGSWMTVGDFNQDGVADLAVAGYGSVPEVDVLVGNGDGTFAAGVWPGDGGGVVAIVSGDLNGDGRSDLVVANRDAGTVTAVLAQGTQTVTAGVSGVAVVGSGMHTIEASYAGDGVYAASGSGTAAVVAAPMATALTLAAAPGGSAYGQQVALTATLSPANAQGVGTDGETVTFLNASVVSMASNAVSSLQNGYLAFGDSNTAGVGYSPSYPVMMRLDYSPAGVGFVDYGVAGFDCLQQDASMMYWLNPLDGGNPVVSDMIGTNDSASLVGNAAGQMLFQQCQYAANARAAMPASRTVRPSASTVQSAGPWTYDPTYPSFPGLFTTAGGASLTTTVELPRGVLYVWYRLENAPGAGTFQVSIDGVPVTDTISSGVTVPTGLGSYVRAVGMARYATTPGSHTVVLTVPPFTGATSLVEIFGLGIPPLEVGTGPYVYLGGVMHFMDDPNDVEHPGLGIADSLNRGVAAGLQADGLNVVFVDVRKYVDPHLGMLAVAEGGCGASANPGLHVNDCGTRELEQAFADAMGLTATPVAEGETTLGTAVLTSGAATLNLTSLPGGVNAVTAVYAGDANFLAAKSGGAAVTVAGAPVGIAWGAPAGMVYGTALSGVQLNASASVPGSFVYTPALGTVLGVGRQTLTVRFTPTDSVSYGAGSVTVVVVVNPAPLTVTAANATRVYGAANPALPGSVSGGVNGDVFAVTGTTAATASSSVGTYSIMPVVSGSALGNYTVSAVNGTLTITAAPVVVAWGVPAAMVYGTALSGAQLNATAATAGTFRYSPAAGTVPGAGTQTLSVAFTPTDGVDYQAGTGSVAVTVNKSALAIGANSAARVYGTANPVFSGTVAGAVNGDVLVEAFSTSAGVGSAVGSYAIVPSVTGANAGNYSVVATNGVLTVKAAGTATSLSLANGNSTLVAGVSPSTSGTPTGTVGFYVGSTLLGTVTLVNGVASYAVSSLPVGSALSARYGGDGNFTGSSSVAADAVSVDVAASSLTVGQVGSVTDGLSVSTVPGYVGTVQFACAGLPAMTTCGFSPGTVGLAGGSGTASVVMTIRTGGNAGVASWRGGAVWAMIWMPGILAMMAGRKRRLGGAMVVFAVGMGLTGCGAVAGVTPTTPVGASTVQVVVSGAGVVVAQMSVILTVQ